MKLTIMLLFTACTLCAGTIQFGTGIGLEGNSMTGTNVAMLTPGVYHAPFPGTQWESVQMDSTSPPISNGTLIEFWFNFMLPGIPDSGNFQILVDDSAKGSLNGSPYLFNNVASPQGVNCAASEPNCLHPLTVDLSPFLLSGANALDVWVSQDGGAQYGLDALGTVNYHVPTPPPPSGVPEPETLILLGGGLLLIGIGRRRQV